MVQVEVEVWTNDRCKASYGSSAPGGITSHMLCASLPDQDSCSVRYILNLPNLVTSSL